MGCSTENITPATLSLPRATEFCTVALADEPIATPSAADPAAPLPIAIDACSEALAFITYCDTINATNICICPVATPA